MKVWHFRRVRCSEIKGAGVIEFRGNFFQLSRCDGFNYCVDSLEFHHVKFEIKTSLIMLNHQHPSRVKPCEDLDTVKLDVRIFLIRESDQANFLDLVFLRFLICPEMLKIIYARTCFCCNFCQTRYHSLADNGGVFVDLRKSRTIDICF